MREPYRTLLGHLRHEVGHYYWDRLVWDSVWLEEFRTLFGDERASYADALKKNYEEGPPADWALRFVSTYAASHPWEDWAETWAHYLHMIDLLETSASYATEVTIPGIYGPQRSSAIDPFASPAPDFQSMVQHLVPLTLLLNSLTRSLGQPDAYPFALASAVLAKLRFVHDMVREAAARPAPVAAPAPVPPAAPAANQGIKKNSKSANKDRR